MVCATDLYIAADRRWADKWRNLPLAGRFGRIVSSDESSLINKEAVALSVGDELASDRVLAPVGLLHGRHKWSR